MRFRLAHLAMALIIFNPIARASNVSSECGRRYSTLLGYSTKEISSELVETREKVWSIFEDELVNRLDSLPSTIRDQVLEVLKQLQWDPNLKPTGRVLMDSSSHSHVLGFEMREAIKGKILSTVYLRHEIEHIIDVIERGERPLSIAIQDLFHPRTLTSRMERRAYKAQYRLAKRIALETKPEILRKVIISESGLPLELRNDFELVLKSISLHHNGQWIYPMNDYHPKAYLLRPALMEGESGSFTADQVRVSTMRIGRYLSAHLQDPSYKVQLAHETPAKAALLTVYGVLGALGSASAYSFFSALFNNELDHAEAPLKTLRQAEPIQSDLSSAQPEIDTQPHVKIRPTVKTQDFGKAHSTQDRLWSSLCANLKRKYGSNFVKEMFYFPHGPNDYDINFPGIAQEVSKTLGGPYTNDIGRNCF